MNVFKGNVLFYLFFYFFTNVTFLWLEVQNHKIMMLLVSLPLRGLWSYPANMLRNELLLVISHF